MKFLFASIFISVSFFGLVHSTCSGACQDTSVYCPSSYVAGQCPGGSNIQCCQEDTSSCNGQCQDNSLPCSGTYASSLCPGPSNVQCCQTSANPAPEPEPEPEPQPEPEPEGSCSGTCQANSNPCPTPYVANLCPGAANIQCCQSSSGNPAPPPSAPTGCASFANSQWNCADPSCSSTVASGSGQNNYECAEFVSRSLAAGGMIPGIDKLAPQSSYSNYKAYGNTYDLLWVSNLQASGSPLGLREYLIAAGWTNCGTSASCVHECTALIVSGSEGAYGHTVVGVGNQVVDSHNNARYQVPPTFYTITDIFNPPSNLGDSAANNTAKIPNASNGQLTSSSGFKFEVSLLFVLVLSFSLLLF